jgi:hypothetical protein
MDAERKIHSNSVLKNLPAEKQAEIIGRLDEGYSYVETVKWLEGAEISVLTETLSEFHRWYLLRHKLNTCSEVSLEKAAECRKRGLVKTLEEERLLAQFFFNRMAREEKDPKMWAMVERVNLAKDKVDLDKEKLKLVTQKLRDKPTDSKETEGTGMSAEEKETAIRQIYGMS